MANKFLKDKRIDLKIVTRRFLGSLITNVKSEFKIADQFLENKQIGLKLVVFEVDVDESKVKYLKIQKMKKNDIYFYRYLGTTFLSERLINVNCLTSHS